MGNAGLYFVNQVSLTAMCIVTFHMYLTTKSFLSQSLKRLFCHALCFKENYLPLLSDHSWDRVLPLEKVISMLSSLKSHSPTPASLPHWRENLLLAVTEANTYLGDNIIFSLFMFFFFFVSHTGLIQCLTHVDTQMFVEWLSNEWEASGKKYKFNQINFLVADMFWGSS